MYLLFDIGGTKMRLAFSRDGERVEEPRVVPTPQNFDEAVRVFVNAGKELSLGAPIRAIAGGITGALDEERDMLLRAPHTENWIGKSLKKEVEREFGVPAFFENDSAVCGLGEAIYGAGRGSKIMMYMTVSTGVGGARIVNGVIDPSHHGFEPGQQILDMPHSFRANTNPSGSLEGFVSGKALQKRFNKKPKEVTDTNVWEELAGELAFGLHNSIVHWTPDTVVLGGSMITGDPAISVEKTQNYLRDILKVYHEVPLIKKAELGDFGGIWGALELARQKTNSSKKTFSFKKFFR